MARSGRMATEQTAGERSVCVCFDDDREPSNVKWPALCRPIRVVEMSNANQANG